jgi:hypothetical protein
MEKIQKYILDSLPVKQVLQKFMEKANKQIMDEMDELVKPMIDKALGDKLRELLTKNLKEVETYAANYPPPPPPPPREEAVTAQSGGSARSRGRSQRRGRWTSRARSGRSRRHRAQRGGGGLLSAMADRVQTALNQPKGAGAGAVQTALNNPMAALQTALNRPKEGAGAVQTALNNPTPVAALNDPAQVAALNDPTQMTALNDPAQVAALNDPVQMTALDAPAQVAALDDPAQVAALDDHSWWDVKALFRNIISELTKCIILEEMKKLGAVSELQSMIERLAQVSIAKAVLQIAKTPAPLSKGGR